jgi:demethylmenaquinone methyltransferase/2-methoxy-6-polyprenyl-1,4-benzoquinol methylase
LATGFRRGKLPVPMANPYYRAGPARARQVQALFATIAPRYDLINDIQSMGWHRRWKRRLFRRTELVPGERVLDLCCGTGDVAFLLERAGGRVVGLDFSLPMLRAAQGRAAAEAVPPAFLAADALALPFPNHSFDVATTSYGLRNLRDIRAGLQEMRRVVRPGGRLVILDFGKPKAALWRWLYFAYLEVMVPVFGRVFCGDSAAYAYILESLRHFPDAAALSALLGETGWVDVGIEPLLGGAMALHWARNSPTQGLR